MRLKNANNSPYKTGNTDTRNFPNQNGVEVLDQQAFMAIADDTAAIVERLAAVETSGGGGSSGAFDIPYTAIGLASPSNNLRAGRCEWVMDGNGIVHGRLVITGIATSGTTGITIPAAFLFGEGLPEPATIGVLSPSLGRLIPMSAVANTGVVQKAQFDADDLGDGFEIAFTSSITPTEVHVVFSYKSA